MENGQNTNNSESSLGRRLDAPRGFQKRIFKKNCQGCFEILAHSANFQGITI
jgi:hypothetical protein